MLIMYVIATSAYNSRLQLHLLTNKCSDSLTHIIDFIPPYEKSLYILSRRFYINSHVAHTIAEHYINVFTHYPENEHEVHKILSEHFKTAHKASNLLEELKKAFLNLLIYYKYDSALQKMDFGVLKDDFVNTTLRHLETARFENIENDSLNLTLKTMHNYLLYLNKTFMLNRLIDPDDNNWKKDFLVTLNTVLSEECFHFLLIFDYICWIILGYQTYCKINDNNTNIILDTFAITVGYITWFVCSSLRKHALLFSASQKLHKRAQAFHISYDNAIVTQNPLNTAGILGSFYTLKQQGALFSYTLLKKLKAELPSFIISNDHNQVKDIIATLTLMKKATANYLRKLLSFKSKRDSISSYRIIDRLIYKKQFYKNSYNYKPLLNEIISDDSSENRSTLENHSSILHRIGNILNFNFYIDKENNTLLHLAYKYKSNKNIKLIKQASPWLSYSCNADNKLPHQL